MNHKDLKRKLASINIELMECHSLIVLCKHEIALLPFWNIKRYWRCRRDLKRLKQRFNILEIEGQLLFANWLRETENENQLAQDIEQIYKEMEL